MNTKLLLAVRDRILEEPETFDMSAYFGDDGVCGTTACIAGHVICEATGTTLKKAVILWNSELRNQLIPPHHLVSSYASELLDLGVGDEEIGWKLFFEENWDEPFSSAYDKAETPEARAQIAGDYILHFITQNTPASLGPGV